jgi:hypothetical protein
MTRITPNTKTSPRVAIVLLISLLAVAARLLWLGQDANWDLLNYHLYNPRAWLEGRMAFDVAPAQLQSYHNPLLDLPLWWLVQSGAGGPVVAAWLALPALIAVFFALRLLDLWRPPAASPLSTAACAALLVSGAAASATLGTSFNDWFVAAGVMASLYLVCAQDARLGERRTWFAAGLAVGLVTGLKLSGVIYCLGLGAAALLGGSRHTSAGRMFAVALGGLLGVALTLGFWAATLWKEFDSPLFPYFNQWLHSPFAEARSFTDDRFKPDGVLDALLAPVELLRGTRAFSELSLRDPRLLLGLLAIVFAPFTLGRATGAAPADRLARLISHALASFFLASLAAWLALYGIYRYLLVLELLAVVALFATVPTWLERLPRFRWAIATALLLAMIAATRPASWGRTDFTSPMIRFAESGIEADALVVVSGWEPVGAAAAFVPPTVPVVAVYNNFLRPDRCNALQLRAQQRLATQRGPVYWLRSLPAPEDDRVWLERLGWQPQGECRRWENSLADFRLCPMARIPQFDRRVFGCASDAPQTSTQGGAPLETPAAPAC